jgi:hypothetical protein
MNICSVVRYSKLALILIYLPPFFATAAADTSPQVILEDGEVAVRLPEQFLNKIKKDFPSLRVPSGSDLFDIWESRIGGEHPYVCWGDFNGDKLTDIAIYLVSDTHWKFAIYHQEETGDFAYVYPKEFPGLMKDGVAQRWFIFTLSKNEKADISKKIKYDAIKQTLLEAPGSIILYLENGKYEEIEYGFNH